MAQAKDGQRPLKVFIVGSPRSGTSILLFAIKAVFGLPGAGESHVIPAFQRMVHHLRSYMSGYAKIKEPILLKRLSREELETSIFDFVRDFYARNYPDGSWVDKTPTGEAVFGLPLIETIFPDARLLMTKRNGIEVASSHMRKFNVNIEEACLNWKNAMMGYIHSRQACKNLLLVDQYDFQNSTKEVCSQIAEHLGMPHSAGALADFFQTQKVEVSSNHDQRTRMKLSDTRWSDAEKAVFKRECGDLMTMFGYEM